MDISKTNSQELRNRWAGLKEFKISTVTNFVITIIQDLST